jgi:predicted NBD/HSP70 family sugar kinase
VQGVVDYQTNILVVSHNKKSWEGESISVPLETQFNVPVYVENDVKAMTLGEYLLGAAKGKKDFVHIWVGDGLGAGIMISGHLLHGITSSAGEIGYNALESASFNEENFPMTYRGQMMFGDILTDANFIESYRRHTRQADHDELSVAMIAQKAASGDDVARQVIEEYSSLLSILCITMVNTLNPELILLGGKLAQHYPAIAEMLQDKIHKDLLAAPAEAVRVRPAMHGESGVILGAVGLVLYELFEPLHRFSVRSARRENLPVPKVAD